MIIAVMIISLVLMFVMGFQSCMEEFLSFWLFMSCLGYREVKKKKAFVVHNTEEKPGCCKIFFQNGPNRRYRHCVNYFPVLKYVAYFIFNSVDDPG